jgi:hypothetical protein
MSDDLIKPETRRKSSRSNASTDNCVVVGAGPGVIGVLDSKHPDGGELIFPRRTWRTFIDTVKDGRHHL